MTAALVAGPVGLVLEFPGQRDLVVPATPELLRARGGLADAAGLLA